MAEPWGSYVRQGSQALLEGRFAECERVAAQAAAMAPDEPAPRLLAVATRREQGRAAEAEAMAREVLAACPGSVAGQALLAAVLADLGRDAEAGRQLDLLGDLDPEAPTEVAALAAEVAAVLYRTTEADAIRRRLRPHAGEVLAPTGAVDRHLGLLGHVLGDWDEAAEHFDAALAANRAAGAPVVLAHTARQYSALLRVRGSEGDWDRAIDLLAGAATVYRRLEIVRLAEETEAVLRRSQELGSDPDEVPPTSVFRRGAGGWDLEFRGEHACVDTDSAGLGHVATLLAAEGRPVHSIDLIGAASGPGEDADAGLRDQMLAEYRARVAGLAAEPSGLDPAGAALARAERDLLLAELEGEPAGGDTADRARRLAALRIRTALDRLEEVLPPLARHLRRGIRTGLFCLYEPDRPERWTIR